VELEIGKLAYGGAGVARIDGFVILVERVLPGERIQAEITQLSRRFARGRLLRIVLSSPHRQPPPCLHDPRCGGCAYQALPYPLQLESKLAQVRELLERIGKIESPPVWAVLPAPTPFGYRRRMSYTLSGEEGVGWGLHQRANPAAVLEVPGCLLPEPDLQRTYERLLEDLRSLKSSQSPRHLELQSGSRSPSPVALFRGGSFPSRELRGLADTWVQGGILRGVLWVQQDSARSRPEAGRSQLLAGVAYVEEALAEFRLRIPAGSFFQANPPLAERIFQEIAIRCGEVQESILELYAGVGALTLFLARGGRRVTAVEGNPDSIRAARENARLNGFHAIEWTQADIRDAIARWARNGAAFDVLVLDPPRSGLPRDGARQLASVARRRILYLSCDPATLARDVRDFLAGGHWKLKEVFPVDFFPHTAGIECLAVLEKG
ncbi:MAG: class I SAM-dependent RNA methyltransferase, partial [Acidobacteria bacterium]|nr:class I SAM-dependent RNA methyltransferase [Acidobacteriota bacterium]